MLQVSTHFAASAKLYKTYTLVHRSKPQMLQNFRFAGFSLVLYIGKCCEFLIRFVVLRIDFDDSCSEFCDFFKKFYTPDNLVVSISGNIDKNKVIDQINNNFINFFEIVFIK